MCLLSPPPPPNTHLLRLRVFLPSVLSVLCPQPAHLWCSPITALLSSVPLWLLLCPLSFVPFSYCSPCHVSSEPHSACCPTCFLDTVRPFLCAPLITTRPPLLCALWLLLFPSCVPSSLLGLPSDPCRFLPLPPICTSEIARFVGELIKVGIQRGGFQINSGWQTAY